MALWAGASAHAEEWIRLDSQGSPRRHIDLRQDGALEALERSNPKHFAQIRRVLVRMRESPSAGPEHWFPAKHRAKDIAFSELSMNPVFPPRYVMLFTLDDIRYAVEVPRRYRWLWPVPRPPRS